MPRIAYEWQGHEYAFEKHGADWYWALGIVALGAAIASVLFGNVLFALVIVLGAAAIGLQATKRPTLHRFALTDTGLIISSRFYPYENIDSFSLIEYLDESLPPALSLKTTGVLSPHLIIPLEGVDPDDIFSYLEQHVPHVPHEPTLTDHLAVWLRL
ncbi:hypothetical protein KGQ55_02195 [Patescibacteria group bacterium]|nr:hypothetical protein [Patescibacteria group bacterium]